MTARPKQNNWDMRCEYHYSSAYMENEALNNCKCFFTQMRLQFQQKVNK